MNEFDQLQERVKILETVINTIVFSDRYVLQKKLQMFDGNDIIFGSIKGTRIGTDPLQKIGFYGTTAVTQYPTIAAPSGGATQDTQARGTINSLLTALKALGLIAT